MPEVTVAAIITRKHKDGIHILLTRRDHDPYKGYWCLPGGHIEINETVESAIVREVKEETQLDFSGKFYHFFQEILPEFSIHHVVLIFAGQANGTLPKRTMEVDAFKWVPIDEVDDIKLAFTHNEVIANFKDYIKGGGE